MPRGKTPVIHHRRSRPEYGYLPPVWHPRSPRVRADTAFPSSRGALLVVRLAQLPAELAVRPPSPLCKLPEHQPLGLGAIEVGLAAGSRPCCPATTSLSRRMALCWPAGQSTIGCPLPRIRLADDNGPIAAIPAHHPDTRIDITMISPSAPCMPTISVWDSA